MNASLADWHRRLDENFGSLRDLRERRTPGRPVFALEHGLDTRSDLPDLMEVVRASIASSRVLSTSYWLPIVVYAAEMGYQYQGDAYWPRFESETPGWGRLGNPGRAYIRERYRHFAEAYGGASPSGRWAEWFTIIAWPITHAVLPVYLQRQLALLLYDHRYVLTAELLHEHEELGKHLASHSHNSSERFRTFAENSSLLGLVAASLLLEGEEDSDLLRSSTLQRIVDDLRRERQAGEWLRSAQHRASIIRRRGFLPRVHEPKRPFGLPISEDTPSSRLELELSVRRSRRDWTVFVTIPNHQFLARRFPDFSRELQRIRYRVDGVTTPRVQPRGALMYERGPFPLSRLPVQGTSVLKPEGASSPMKQLLVDSCRLTRGPWLFHLRESHYGVEIRTRQVRPGHEYLILSSPMTQITSRLCVPVPLSTVGATAYHLTVPDSVDSSTKRELNAVGVGVVSEAQIWPAGLVPARWNGAGRAAWQLGDTPMIGIQSNRAASMCRVAIGESTIEVPWPTDTDILFLQLLALDTGTHLVQLTIHSDNDEGLIAEGQFEVSIIEPAETLRDSGARQGLRVMSHPAQPTFAELWAGEAAIVADGPPDERVKFEIDVVQNRDRHEVALTPFSSKLPIDDYRWWDLWNTAQGNWRASHGESGLLALAAEARELFITVSNPKLGSIRVGAERPFSPLRWFGGSDRIGPFVKLIDLTDREDRSVDYYDVRFPTERQEPRLDDKGLVRSRYGGLAVAGFPGYTTGIILPPVLSGKGLQSLHRLNVRPSVRMGHPSRRSLSRMVRLARLWTGLGSIMDNRALDLQSTVNEAIVTEISRVICGGRWWNLIEDQIMEGNLPTYQRLLTALGDAPEEYRLASLLQEAASAVSPDPFERAVAFVETLGLNPESIETITNIVRLATAPGTIVLDESEAAEAIELMLTEPSVYRLARLFVVTIANYENTKPFATLRSWPW